MAWITPKTDWDSESYINFTDYNRICNNLDEVKKEGTKLGFNVEWSEMASVTDESDLSYADMWNTIIDNYNQFADIQYSRIEDVFTTNGYYIAHDTLNPLEVGTSLLHTLFSVAIANIPRLAIRLGGSKIKV